MKQTRKKEVCLLAALTLLLTCFGASSGNSAYAAGDDSAASEDTAITEDGENHSENGYVIKDGMAQRILQFSSFRDEDYSNAESDIQRFCVYVETDHDTDNDGMDDLVKVFLQVPTAAVNGDYKAAVIYDPTPYNAGTTKEFGTKTLGNYNYYNTGFDYETLYKAGQKRPTAAEISTQELALTENQDEWNYTVPATGAAGYNYADHYDYYLVRGFAVAECAGIGTLGSQGYELCGFDLEAEAHKCVVEWLAGNRVAFSDKKGTREVKADWSNGKIAMTGCSYGGTLPYEVATLGVEGLETIIPFAGIASWYDYTNSQGVTRAYYGNYIDMLAAFNCGSLFLDDDWTVVNPDYASLLVQISNDQNEANGNYTDIWRLSDYSDDYENIKCSALIIHGLNDFNVRTTQSDKMVQAFQKAGQTVKLVLHQNGHGFLDGIMVGDEVWQDVMNRWLCHYLLGTENGIENMPEVTYQSNVDGKFYTADHWRDFNYEQVNAAGISDFSTISSKGLDETKSAFLKEEVSDEDGGVTASGTDGEIYVNLMESQAAVYELGFKAGDTVYGVPTVHFTASPSTSDLTGLKITAVLVDVKEDGSAFPAYMTKTSLRNRLPVRTVDHFDEDAGYEGTEIKEFVKSYTTAKVIGTGWTDLANPGGGEDPNDYSEDTAIQAGEFYDYTIYLCPTVYTLEPGHTLKLVLLTNDPLQNSLEDEEYYVDYGYTVDNTSLDVEIPTLK